MMGPRFQAFALASAVCLAGVNLLVAIVFHQPAPHWDMVDVEAFFARWSLVEDGLGPLLTYRDNEHRSFLPLLLQAIDHHVFASRGVFLAMVHGACFAGAAAMIAHHLRLSFCATRYALLAVAAGVLVMLWSEHWYNISRLKQTHICLALVSMCGAFWLLARFAAQGFGGSRRGWVHVGGAAALLVNAGWSFAAGLAALPGVIVFVAVRGFSWGQRGAIVAAGLFAVLTRAWASALAGSPGVPQGDDGAGLLAMGHYLLNFIGGFSRRALGGDEVIAPILGLLGLGLCVPVLWRALRPGGMSTIGTDVAQIDGDQVDGAQVDGPQIDGPQADLAQKDRARRQGAGFFAMLMVWTLICAIGIAPNRAQLGADQAFVGRYLLFSVTFWLSLAGMVGALNWPRDRHLRQGLRYGAMVFLALIVVMQPRGWLKQMEHERRVALGGVAAGLDIRDGQYRLVPRAGQANLDRVIEAYRARRASFYARAWGQWLGQDVAEVFVPAPPARCARIGAQMYGAGLNRAGPAGRAGGAGNGGGFGGDTAWALRIGGAVRGGGRWIAVSDGSRVVGVARRGEMFETSPIPGGDDGTPDGAFFDGASYAGFARVPFPLGGGGGDGAGGGGAEAMLPALEVLVVIDGRRTCAFPISVEDPVSDTAWMQGPGLGHGGLG